MSELTIEYTKQGKPIPIINGVYLHSIFNPEKEAETFFETNKHKLREESPILVLGLGFGYHIDAITNQVNNQVFVVEPETSLIEKYIGLESSQNLNIFNPDSISELFDSKDFIELLLLKPTILIHQNSFNLNKKFFTDFLNFRADNRPVSYSKNLSPQWNQTLESSSHDFENFIQELDQPTTQFKSNEYLLLSLNEIIG